MKTKATPHHRLLFGLLTVTGLGCFIYALVLYPQPWQVLLAMVPLLIVFTVVFIPYYRGHKGVTYDVEDDAIILWKGKRMRRRIPLGDVVSVRNQNGAVILRRRGFWRGSECLHPMSKPDEFAKEIEEKLQNQPVDRTA